MDHRHYARNTGQRNEQMYPVAEIRAFPRTVSTSDNGIQAVLGRRDISASTPPTSFAARGRRSTWNFSGPPIHSLTL